MLTADVRSFRRQGQWEGAFRKPIGQRHGWLAIFALALAAFAFIEVSLLFRSWTQLSAEGLNSWWKDFLYQTGGSLASPFARYETVPLSRSSDVLQYSVLVAAEAYFVIAAATLFVIGMVHAPFNALVSEVSDVISTTVGFFSRGALRGATELGALAWTGSRVCWHKSFAYYCGTLVPAFVRVVNAAQSQLTREAPIVARNVRTVSHGVATRSEREVAHLVHAIATNRPHVNRR